MHRPRGAFCHDGWCQQCRVTLGDGSVVLACQQHGETERLNTGGSFVRRLLGRVTEQQPPWFYESHFLRPKFLRQGYLNLLRRLSGAKRLPDTPPASGEAWRRLSCNALVVGGGIAGLAAARELALAGRSVIVIDARRSREKVSAPDDGAAAAAAALEAGCSILAETVCVGLYEKPRRALCVGTDVLVIEHRELVVATGAYDRLLPFDNNDLPGIVGVRGLEILVAQRALTPACRIGVYGESTEVDRALAALKSAGVSARWAAGPGDLSKAVEGVTSHQNVRLESAEGRARVEAVRLSGVGRLDCDLLVLGFSQPGYELQLQRGARLDVQGLPRKLVPVISQAGLLVVGEAAGDSGEATVATDAARRTHHWLRTGENLPAATVAATHELCRGGHPDAFICPCEDVRVRDIRDAIAAGYNDIELIKRHTGAATGPCQGKLCHGNLMDCLAENRLELRVPTQRPLVRPIQFARFAGAPEE